MDRAMHGVGTSLLPEVAGGLLYNCLMSKAESSIAYIKFAYKRSIRRKVSFNGAQSHNALQQQPPSTTGDLFWAAEVARLHLNMISGKKTPWKTIIAAAASWVVHYQLLPLSTCLFVILIISVCLAVPVQRDLNTPIQMRVSAGLKTWRHTDQ